MSNVFVGKYLVHIYEPIMCNFECYLFSCILRDHREHAPPPRALHKQCLPSLNGLQYPGAL